MCLLRGAISAFVQGIAVIGGDDDFPADGAHRLTTRPMHVSRVSTACVAATMLPV